MYCRLQVSAGRLTSAEPWWEKNNPPNMKSITSVQEMVDAMVRQLLLFVLTISAAKHRTFLGGHECLKSV